MLLTKRFKNRWRNYKRLQQNNAAYNTINEKDYAQHQN